ncbi:MAG: beta-glucanase, partial [bacterium]|nr:beta-glucanase [bacterium]
MRRAVLLSLIVALGGAVSAKQVEIRPGAIWHDTAGHVINAHGCGVMFDQGVYWWYGEHKVYGRAGNKAHVGVHVYSSTDL